MPDSMVDALKELAAENREEGLSLNAAYIAAAAELHEEFVARRNEIGEKVDIPPLPEELELGKKPLADLSDDEVDEIFMEMFG